ncbi:hypothetical protein BpHYR1_041266 [Brachionus plicatilis]|uniref:Uncharacterized protein n=1 Tax=Brachionus plicatilis TaxID=10195 RepID=A0A3M7QTV2_BRAPC|nr:hypothetical protein BpHYR1_041266 [Brachionus plicatilis]
MSSFSASMRFMWPKYQGLASRLSTRDFEEFKSWFEVLGIVLLIRWYHISDKNDFIRIYLSCQINQYIIGDTNIIILFQTHQLVFGKNLSTRTNNSLALSQVKTFVTWT